MKSAVPAFTVALLAGGSALAAPKTPACLQQPGTLMVFAGQSNMVGWGMSPMTLPKGYMKTDPLTCIWTAKGWQPMRPGFNTPSPDAPRTWGAEASFARAFRVAHPNQPLLIVKSSVGGTGIAPDPAEPDWWPDTRGELTDQASAAIAAARRALPRPTPVSAVFWMQGETDATWAWKAPAYRANFPYWLATIRRRWMADPQGFVAWGRITTRLPYATTVRDVQRDVHLATPNTAMVEADDLALQHDMLHIASRGHVELGERFFRAWRAQARSAKVAAGFAIRARENP